MGEERPRWAQCALLGAQTACICMLIFDILVIAHAIAYIITRLAHDQQAYSEDHSQMEKVLPYDYFSPFLVLLCLWALSAGICFVALKCVIPYLVLPYLSVSIVVLGVDTGLLVYSAICVAQYLRTNREVTLELSLLLALSSVFCLIEAYSLSIKYSTFKSLVKRKKAVQGTMEKPAIAEVVDPLESFSRRSTVIISDDFFDPPPMA